MARSFGYLAAALVLSTCTGCAAVGMHSPVITQRSRPVASFPTTVPIALISAQTSSTRQDLGFRGIVVDLQDATEVLVRALERQLQHEGHAIVEAADRQLAISVTKIDMTTTGSNFRATIRVEVIPGDRESLTFETTRASFLNGYNMMYRATAPLDAAMTDAVESILQSPVIRDYLTQ